MDDSSQQEVTRLLSDGKQGDEAALHSLMPLVDAELRRLAGGYMRRERSGHTLQPAALVKESLDANGAAEQAGIGEPLALRSHRRQVHAPDTGGACPA